MPDSSQTEKNHINQDFLIRKLIQFIEIENRQSIGFFQPAYCLEKQDPERYKSIVRGLCFGLSITHSYMNATGHLQWWHALLHAVSSWDMQESSLNQEISLPEKDSENTREERSLKKTNLKELLRRLTNYALYNQSMAINTPLETLENQRAFLKPFDTTSSSQPTLRFDSEKGQIQSNYVIAGSFSDQLLHKFFTTQDFNQEAIYLIISIKHACAIRYSKSNQAWYLYDPDFSEGEKSFDTVDRFVSAIKESIGATFRFNIATWSQTVSLDSFRQFYELLSINEKLSMISNNGLSFIVSFSPRQLDTLIGPLATNTELRNSFSEQLYFLDEMKCNALYRIAMLTHNKISAIIDLAIEYTTFRNNFAFALCMKTPDGDTALDLIAKNFPDQMVKIIQLAHEHTTFRDLFVKAVSFEWHDKKTLLHTLVEFSPEALGPFIALAKNYSVIQGSLINFIVKCDHRNRTGFHMIAGFAPDELEGILELAKNKDDLRKEIAMALSMMDDDDYTGLDVVAMFSRHNLNQIFDLAVEDKNFQNALSNALKISVKYMSLAFILNAREKLENWDGLHIITRHGPLGAVSKMLDQADTKL